MSKIKQVKKTKKDDIFPFERENYIILAIGLVVIVFGYIALSENSVDGFAPITLAPILLLIGYCVIIPFGILYRKKEKETDTQTSSPPVPH